MTRIVEMEITIDVQRISYEQVVFIDLANFRLADWCLNLCLLKEGLTEELLFLGTTKLKIGVNKSPESSPRATVSVSSNEISMIVHPQEIEYWLSFFLKYYRDGVAEVDHIDVEALLTNSAQPEEVCVIFKVKDAVPPMSAKEARKILDKYD